MLCLGDSYTIGESVAAGQRWPAQLCKQLVAQGCAQLQTEIIAKTGWTTDELAVAIDQQELAAPYDLVSLLIGVNNQYRSRDLAEYAMQFSILLAKAISLARFQTRSTLVISIPDWGVSDFAKKDSRGARQIALEIDAFNAVAQSICKAANVCFIDITGLSRKVNAKLLAHDGLHPSALAYKQWVQKILPVASAMLSQSA
jgi:lysophospholipase L1-like esterase